MTATVATNGIRPATSSRPRTAPRTDIQAMRALAVSLVFAYHLLAGPAHRRLHRRGCLLRHLWLPDLFPPAPSTAGVASRSDRLLGPACQAPASRVAAGSGVHAGGFPIDRAGDAVGQHRQAGRFSGSLRRELDTGRRLGGLPGGRERAVACAALLVAVGGGAVLLCLAAAHRGAGLGQPTRSTTHGNSRSRRCRRSIADRLSVVDRHGSGRGLLRHTHPGLGVRFRRRRSLPSHRYGPRRHP